MFSNSFVCINTHANDICCIHFDSKPLPKAMLCPLSYMNLLSTLSAVAFVDNNLTLINYVLNIRQIFRNEFHTGVIKHMCFS